MLLKNEVRLLFEKVQTFVGRLFACDVSVRRARQHYGVLGGGCLVVPTARSVRLIHQASHRIRTHLESIDAVLANVADGDRRGNR